MPTVEENRAKWLAALRSGEFKQGTEYLRRADDSMCCLGVAATLFAPEGVEPVLDGKYFKFVGAAGCAPPYVVEALGLHDDLGRRHSGRAGLASMNDRGATFAEIADEFEKNVEDFTK